MSFKQSPRAQFGKFVKVMLALGHMIFIKHSDSSGVTALLVYSDNIIVIENNKKEKEELRRCLVRILETKELGRLRYF